MRLRSNEEWLQVLRERHTVTKSEVLAELRDYLVRSVLVYLSLHRDELAERERQVIREFAEDVAQDALTNILDNLEAFRGESKFTTWAYRFAINQAASELRRQRYRDLSLDQLLEEASDALESLFAASDREALERQIEQRAYLELLRDLIATQLTERQRAAIIGIYLQGYSMDEVADALDTNRNALYKLLYDARKRLRDALLAGHLTQNDILAAFDE
jgi:RNA polymerase sigma-70 factor, ECF subfamily